MQQRSEASCLDKLSHANYSARSHLPRNKNLNPRASRINYPPAKPINRIARKQETSSYPNRALKFERINEEEGGILRCTLRFIVCLSASTGRARYIYAHVAQ